MAKKPTKEQTKRLKDLKEELKLAQKALREGEETYRLHFENASDVIFSIDPDLKILSVSPSVERIIGYKPEELNGESFLDLGLVADEYLEAATSDAMRVLAGEGIPSSVYAFIAKDGTRKFGEVSAAPLVRNGKVVESSALPGTSPIESKQSKSFWKERKYTVICLKTQVRPWGSLKKI